MNTKSMILALNSLLLFNTVHPRFGISSLRKKIVNICAKLGKKSISIVCGIALVLLSAMGLKGAQVLAKGQNVRRAWNSSHAMHTPQMPRQNLGTVLNRAQAELRARAQVRSSQMLRVGVRSAASVFPPGQPSFEASDDQLQSEEQQSDDNCNQEAILAVAQLCHQEEFKKVLDEIKSREYYLNYLPKQLRGPKDNPNLLERMPKWVVNMIIQCIHQNDLYHERSFYVPSHRSEPEVLQGRPREGYDYQISTLNFIDGDPDTVELAYCPPQNRGNDPTNQYLGSIDVITIDTKTCSQHIEMNVRQQSLDNKPTSYQQRVIGHELLSTTSPSLLPLIQQFSFIDSSNSGCRIWREGNKSYSDRDYRNNCVGNLFEWGKKNPFTYGLQRNIHKGKVVWTLPKDRWVGIYEKAQPWYDESGVFKHPEFESVRQDSSGITFHLVQVIQEEAPVRTVALPHTPVYLNKPDGEELRKELKFLLHGTTAHLRSPDEYPERIDALAIGLNSTYTNTRLSLYRQRGDNLFDYPPELLLHQQSLVTPKRKDKLYPDEPDMPRPSLTLAGEIQVGLHMARRAACQAVGIE